MPSPVEETVLRHLTAGDLTRAATEAIRAYGPEVLKYLRATLHDAVAADEVFAQWSENLWRSLSRFRGEAALKTWIYRLAANAAADQRRDPFGRRGRRLETEELVGAVAEVHTRTPYFMKTEARRELDHFKASLDAGERALLVLRLENGLSWREVADTLSAECGAVIDEGAAKKRFERLRNKLAKLAHAAHDDDA